MLKKLLLSAVLVTQLTCAHAQTREEMIQRLNQLSGAEAIYEKALQDSHAHMEAEIEKSFEPFFNQLDTAPEMQQEMKAIILKVSNKYKDSITAKDMMRIWEARYYSQFSDSEIKELLAFNASSIGIKSNEAVRKALPEYTKDLQLLSEPIQKAAMEDYGLELRALIERLKTQKPRKHR